MKRRGKYRVFCDSRIRSELHSIVGRQRENTSRKSHQLKIMASLRPLTGVLLPLAVRSLNGGIGRRFSCGLTAGYARSTLKPAAEVVEGWMTAEGRWLPVRS